MRIISCRQETTDAENRRLDYLTLSGEMRPFFSASVIIARAGLKTDGNKEYSIGDLSLYQKYD